MKTVAVVVWVLYQILPNGHPYLHTEMGQFATEALCESAAMQAATKNPGGWHCIQRPKQ